jgi:hypothetical protein
MQENSSLFDQTLSCPERHLIRQTVSSPLFVSSPIFNGRLIGDLMITEKNKQKNRVISGPAFGS